ncbi:MAG: DegT/DnrJ/EryC1/StrS aminotransferase family protein [Candidatus Magasanikbacteria bacterium]|nr:DegT/DnrJ/EryC1/StrS aminotransferase family protein [Candidatus Magasanikbacteria bacterium]
MNKWRIPVAEPTLTGREAEYVVDAIINENRISSSGKYLDQFEKYGRDYFQREFALSCSNGTVALELALRALKIGPGDEVIVPTFTFAATAATVLHVGATPVFIDSNQNDWNLDCSKLEAAYTSKTKAIIAVDIYGLPCDYEVIESWCKEKGIYLIEDAAESHGAEYKGRRVGSFGDISCFSFYGNKIITTGEGGMCLTNNPEWHEAMRVLKNHGMPTPGVYEYEMAGYNYRLTNLQAAVGCAQFERIEEFLKIRREHEALYRSLLSSAPVTFPAFDSNVSRSACWFVSILLSEESKNLALHLAEKGIETRPFFTPMHAQKPYAHLSVGQEFPVAMSIARHGISLPSSPNLKDSEIEFICLEIQNYLKDKKS